MGGEPMISPLMYIKLGAAVATLVAALWIGYQWAHRACEAGKTAAVVAVAEEYKKSVEEAKQEAEKQRVRATTAIRRYESTIAGLKTDNQRLLAEIKNATEVFKPTPDAPAVALPPALFTMEFGRVWNDSTARASNGGMSAPAANTRELAEADLRLSTITRESILVNHDAVMQHCGAIKAQLDAILEWDKETFEK